MSKTEIERELAEARSALFAYLLASVRHYQDAEDLLQEVSLVAIQAADHFTPGTSFLAWSREIARRRVLEYARKRDRRPAYLEPEVIDSLAAAAEAVENEEPIQRRREVLDGCLSMLRSEFRDVLRMKYWNRSSAEQIAGEVGRSVQAVYAILKRTRADLRDCADRKMRCDETQ